MKKQRAVKILLVEIANRNLGNSIIADNTSRLLAECCKKRRIPYELLHYSIYSNDPEQVRYVDAVIFVGGAFLKFRHEKFYSQIHALLTVADACKVPVFFNGVGIEGFDSTDERCLMLKQALSFPCVKGISVRDDLDTLVNDYLEKRKLPVKAVFDPAVWCPETYAEYLKDITPRPVIGLGITRENLFADNGHPEIDRKFQLDYWKSIVKLLEAKGLDWELFTNGASRDELFAQDVLSYIGHGSKAPTPVQAHHVVTTIAGYSGIIAGRMHSNIVAYSLGVPSVGLIWNEKLSMWGQRIRSAEQFMTVQDMRKPAKAVNALLAAQAKPKRAKRQHKMPVMRALRRFVRVWVKPRSGIPVQKELSSRIVAAAMGTQQMKYKNLNNTHALQAALSQGYRWLELDVRLTSDNVAVCVNGFNTQVYRALGYPPDKLPKKVPTAEAFLSRAYYGNYATCSFLEMAQALAQQMKQGSFRLILDVRCNNSLRLEELYSQIQAAAQTCELPAESVYLRIMRQQDLALARKIGLPFELMYYLPKEDELTEEPLHDPSDIAAFCQQEGISWISMRGAAFSPSVAELLHNAGLRCCVLNFSKTADILYALDNGADLVGSDCYCAAHIQRLVC